MADYSSLSDADLEAIAAGDWANVSDGALEAVAGTPAEEPEDDRSTWQKVKDVASSAADVVTGNKRLAEANEVYGDTAFAARDEVTSSLIGQDLDQLPELFNDPELLKSTEREGELDPVMAEASRAAGYSGDPQELADYMAKTFQGAETLVIGGGVLMDWVNPRTGERQIGWVNKPGFSNADVGPALVEGGLSVIPGLGGAVRGGKGVVGAARTAGRVGAQEGAINAAVQGLGSSATGEDIRLGEIAASAGLGAAGGLLGKWATDVPLFDDSGKLTKAGREVVREMGDNPSKPSSATLAALQDPKGAPAAVSPKYKEPIKVIKYDEKLPQDFIDAYLAKVQRYNEVLAAKGPKSAAGGEATIGRSSLAEELQPLLDSAITFGDPKYIDLGKALPSYKIELAKKLAKGQGVTPWFDETGLLRTGKEIIGEATVAGGITSKKQAAKALGAIKKQFGKDSTQWKEVREGLFERLSDRAAREGSVSPETIAEAWAEMNADLGGMLDTVFTPAELAVFKQLVEKPGRKSKKLLGLAARTLGAVDGGASGLVLDVLGRNLTLGDVVKAPVGAKVAVTSAAAGAGTRATQRPGEQPE